MKHWNALQSEFSVTLPDWYREMVAGQPDDDAEWVIESADELRELNRACRAGETYGFEWSTGLWAIGGDGCGGIFFIDTTQPKPLVYYLDHEQPAASINDTEALSPSTVDEFLNDLNEADAGL